MNKTINLSFSNTLKNEAKGASIYTISTFLTQFSSFLIVPFFWRELSVSDYGLIGVIEIIGSIAGVFLGLQLDFSLTRFYYEWSDEERKSNTGTLWVANWISTLLLGFGSLCILIIFNDYVFINIPFYSSVLLGLIGTFLGKLVTFPFATLRIVNLPSLYFFYSITSFFIKMLLNIFFVLILKKKLQGYFLSEILGNIFTCCFGIIIMFRFARPCLKWKIFRDAIRFSLPAIPTGLISSGTTFLDRFLLLKFATIEALGIYTLCLKFTNLVLQLHGALKVSFVPFMVKTISLEKKDGIKKLTQIRFYYLLPLFILSLAISLFIKDFTLWINKAEYFPVSDWVPWLIGPTLFSTLTVYYAPGLFLAKRTDLTWIPSTIQFFVVLTCGFSLIPYFGMNGVVISRYASVFALFIFNFKLSQKYYHIPINLGKLTFLSAFLLFTFIFSSLLHSSHLSISIITNLFLLIFYSIISLLTIMGISKYHSFFMIAKNKFSVKN